MSRPEATFWLTCPVRRQKSCRSPQMQTHLPLLSTSESHRHFSVAYYCPYRSAVKTASSVTDQKRHHDASKHDIGSCLRKKLPRYAVTQRAIRLTILPLRKVPFVDISINSTTIAPLTSSTVLCISQWNPLSRPSVIYKSLSGCLPILNVMLLILIDCCCRVSRVMEFNLAHSTCFCGIWSA